MIYEVIVDIGATEVDRVFDYSSDWDIELGRRVVVPFGKTKKVEGFVLGKKDKSEVETKEIEAVLDDRPVVIPEMLALCDKLTETCAFRRVDALRLFVPPKLRGGRVREKLTDIFALVEGVDADAAAETLKKNAVAQKGILSFLKENGETEGKVLRDSYSVSALTALEKSGLISRKTVRIGRTPYKSIKPIVKEVELNAEQQEAVRTIENSDKTRILIHGVTGSGKTEIYMRVIKNALDRGKTAVMLVPEISLTPQMLAVFRGRFGDCVAMLHSALSDGERFDEWRRILTGDARVVVGARSAVFAPISNIGAIIIDEEHDSSYVNDREPRYVTEDVAMFRAEYNGAKLILGSATPSLESYKKALDGESELITLKRRANNKTMPEIKVIDMRPELRSGNFGLFSRELAAALTETLERGEQAMIFLNRRGYASFMRCRECGHVEQCPHCEVSLRYHKERNKLVCHYCGYEQPMHIKCPKCGSTSMKEGRTGTEKVVEELKRVLPEARVLRMDNDTTTTKDAYLKILTDFREKKADILVGTQMIAKGHDFPDVTLVGIIDADLTLYFPDFRSNERTFQLITQVAGRAGRDDKAGRVILQTYNPRHYVFRYAETYDYRGFYDKEASVREGAKFPPFTKIVKILVTSSDPTMASQGARACYDGLREIKERYPGLIRLQIMRAPIGFMQDKHRFLVFAFLWGKSADKIIKGVYETAHELNKRKEIAVSVDLNPQQMT